VSVNAESASKLDRAFENGLRHSFDATKQSVLQIGAERAHSLSCSHTQLYLVHILGCSDASALGTACGDRQSYVTDAEYFVVVMLTVT